MLAVKWELAYKLDFCDIINQFAMAKAQRLLLQPNVHSTVQA